jgi:hypothetical protein
MKRSALGLPAIADWHNLTAAFFAAARGKRDRPVVRHFAAHLDRNLFALQEQILCGMPAKAPMSSFWINDPKRRLIHAPQFHTRVLYHAVMAQVGPVLERALVFDSYACRVGKGTLAAVLRCQQHIRRFPIFVKIDIAGYFPAIGHDILGVMLERRFKDQALLRLLDNIVAACPAQPGKGLPIGALSSQHLANFYLTGLDRLLLETLGARGMVRYMDDVIWWHDDIATARLALKRVESFVRDDLLLDIKQPREIGRSAAGVGFCGFRILPGALRLSARRRRRYGSRRRSWEAAFDAGQIGEFGLQTGYASCLAITAHADAGGWRREQLRRRPVAGAAALI